MSTVEPSVPLMRSLSRSELYWDAVGAAVERDEFEQQGGELQEGDAIYFDGIFFIDDTWGVGALVREAVLTSGPGIPRLTKLVRALLEAAQAVLDMERDFQLLRNERRCQADGFTDRAERYRSEAMAKIIDRLAGQSALVSGPSPWAEQTNPGQFRAARTLARPQPQAKAPTLRTNAWGGECWLARCGKPSSDWRRERSEEQNRPRLGRREAP